MLSGYQEDENATLLEVEGYNFHFNFGRGYEHVWSLSISCYPKFKSRAMEANKVVRELGKERGRSEEVKNDAWEFQSESC